eukprot:TRINITY_DN14301_c0_g1_i2.p1 TRINITY_DN14301_c0_g1~~TRINITY_DN14301_c0_g1_i2.p1  ORF type:complete len:1058 (+),score=353.42 TRINITY_DN14301_c0_g1_i2:305-3478(+)
MCSWDDSELLCKVSSLETDDEGWEPLSLFFPARLAATLSSVTHLYMDGRVRSTGSTVRALEPNLTQLLPTAPAMLLFGSQQLSALNLEGHSLPLDANWAKVQAAASALGSADAVYALTRTSGVAGSKGELWRLTARNSTLLTTSELDRGWGDAKLAEIVGDSLFVVAGSKLMCVALDSQQAALPTTELCFPANDGKGYDWSEAVASCSDGEYLYIAESTSLLGAGGALWRLTPGATDRELISDDDWGRTKAMLCVSDQLLCFCSGKLHAVSKQPRSGFNPPSTLLSEEWDGVKCAALLPGSTLAVVVSNEGALPQTGFVYKFDTADPSSSRVRVSEQDDWGGTVAVLPLLPDTQAQWLLPRDELSRGVLALSGGAYSTMSAADLSKLFDTYDVDKNGSLERDNLELLWADLLAASRPCAAEETHPPRCADGGALECSLTVAELARKAAAQTLQQIDCNQDGAIDRAELGTFLVSKGLVAPHAAAESKQLAEVGASSYALDSYWVLEPVLPFEKESHLKFSPAGSHRTLFLEGGDQGLVLAKEAKVFETTAIGSGFRILTNRRTQNAVCNGEDGLKMAAADNKTVQWKLIPVPATSVADSKGLFFVCSRRDGQALAHSEDGNVAMQPFDPSVHNLMWHIEATEPEEIEGETASGEELVLTFFSNVDDLNTTVYAFAKSLYAVHSRDGRYLRVEEGWSSCVAAAMATGLEGVFAVTSHGLLSSTGSLWLLGKHGAKLIRDDGLGETRAACVVHGSMLVLLTGSKLSVFSQCQDSPAGFKETVLSEECSQYVAMCTDGQHLYLAARDGGLFGDGGRLVRISLEPVDGSVRVKHARVLCEKGDWGATTTMCVLLDRLCVFVPGVLYDLGDVTDLPESGSCQPVELSRDPLFANVKCACCGAEASHMVACTSEGVLPSSGKMFTIKPDGRVDIVADGWGNTRALADLGDVAQQLVMPASNFLQRYFAKAELSESDLEEIWGKYDRDDDARVSDDEAEAFLRDLCAASGREVQGGELQDLAQRVVEAMDSDGNGFISKGEFLAFFKGHSLAASVGAAAEQKSA